MKQRVKAWIVVSHVTGEFVRAMTSKLQAKMYAWNVPQNDLVVRGFVEFDDGKKPKKRKAKR